MPKPRAYIETTIPNFYYDRRPAPDMAARRRWTREWWSRAANEYELVTGAPVVAELLAGISPRVASRISLVSGLPLLIPDSDADEVVQVYLRQMPGRWSLDALHLALASLNACDLIVTWNCGHLANPNKFHHVARINARLGLHVPEIATPVDLLRRKA